MNDFMKNTAYATTIKDDMIKLSFIITDNIANSIIAK